MQNFRPTNQHSSYPLNFDDRSIANMFSNDIIESASRLDEVNPGIPASVPQEKMLFLAILY